MADDEGLLFVKFYEERPGSPPVECIRWAWRNTPTVHDWKREAMPLLVTMALTFVVMQAWKPAETHDQLLYLALSFVIAYIAVPLVRFAKNLVKAPYALLDAENSKLRTEVAELRLLISGKESALFPPGGARTHVTIDDLAAKRKWAIHNLLNRAIRSVDDLRTLKTDIASWEADVLPVLTQLGAPDEVMDFQVLGAYNYTAAGGFNMEHDRELAMLWERVQRLRNVIKRLGRAS